MEQFKSKDFDRWNHKKKFIDSLPNDRSHFHEAEIWWCSLGLNVGYEEDGKNEFFERPILILRKFNHSVAWAIPLTSKKKTHPYYLPLKNPGIKKDSYLILSQLRLVSVKRLRRRMGKVSELQMSSIRDALNQILFKKSEPPFGSSSGA